MTGFSESLSACPLDEAATGPFAQFQNSPDEEDAITGLVLQLIRRHPQAAPRDEAVRRQVQTFRETVATLLKSRGKEPVHHAARVDETSVAKFFEEIKVLVRDVPDRVARELGNDSGMRRSFRKRRRFHPMMVDELFHRMMYKKSPDQFGLPILMMFSLVRDDYPWLYELGMKLYRAIEGGNSSEIERARKTVTDMMEMARRDPIMHELAGPEDEEAMMALDYLVHNLDRAIRMPKTPTSSDAKSPKEGE